MITIPLNGDVLVKLININTYLKLIDFQKIDEDLLKKSKVLIYEVLETRKNILQNEYYLKPSDVISLIKFESYKILKDNYVVIKVGDVIAPIKIGENVSIENNFNPVKYCVVKNKGIQTIEEACKFDVMLYECVELYQRIKEIHIQNLDKLKKDSEEIRIGDIVRITKKSNAYSQVQWFQVIAFSKRSDKFKIRNILNNSYEYWFESKYLTKKKNDTKRY